MAIVFDYESIAKGLQNRWIPIRQDNKPINRCYKDYDGVTCPNICVKAYAAQGSRSKY